MKPFAFAQYGAGDRLRVSILAGIPHRAPAADPYHPRQPLLPKNNNSFETSSNARSSPAAFSPRSLTWLANSVATSTPTSPMLARSSGNTMTPAAACALTNALRQSTRPNAAGTSSPSPAESSIAKESAATHPRSGHTPDRPPPTHRSSPQLSPPPSPESAPPLLWTSPLHHPCRTCTRIASAPPLAAPHPSHSVSTSHPYPAPTRSLPRPASDPR